MDNPKRFDNDSEVPSALEKRKEMVRQGIWSETLLSDGWGHKDDFLATDGSKEPDIDWPTSTLGRV